MQSGTSRKSAKRAPLAETTLTATSLNWRSSVRLRAIAEAAQVWASDARRMALMAEGNHDLPDKAPALHSIAYRPDIDGLRAIAILLVLLFHSGFSSFSGGFIGVDVFFVISGFIITSLILTELRNGTFSFSRFYSRRIRRLLPALLVTVLLSFCVATLVMAPDDLVDAAKSGALAAGSLANFYFAKHSSYFDSSAQSKPFLHMWSLSVEEQFYMFWPAILLLLYRWTRNWVTPALVLIGIPVGMAVSQYWITKNPNQAYFLLHTRGFQFLMGAACIWLSCVNVRSRVLGHAIWVAGLALILAPAVLFSDATPFPGLAAAAPSVGAMFLIWQGQRFPLRNVLASRGVVWFGRISYSTYLVHWPLIVFWLYLSIDPLSTAEKLMLFILSVIGGQLLDSLVTQRFRYAQPETANAWRFTATQFSLIALVSVFSLFAIATSGMPWRFALAPRVAKYRDESLFPFLRDYGDGVLHIGSSGVGRVLIFGDSMAQNYIPAILQLDGLRNAEIDIFSRGGCVLAKGAVLVNNGSRDEECSRLREHLYQVDRRYDLVIWSQNWLGYGRSLHWEGAHGELTPAFSGAAPAVSGWRAAIEGTLEHFASRANKIVVIGTPVTVDNVNPIIRHIGPVTDIDGIAAHLGSMKESSTDASKSLEHGIRALVTGRQNTLYIDPHSIICGDLHCHLSNRGVSYYLDDLHNTSAAIPLLREGLAGAGLGL